MAVRDQLVTDRYAIYNGDSCEVLKSMPQQHLLTFAIFAATKVVIAR